MAFSPVEFFRDGSSAPVWPSLPPSGVFFCSFRVHVPATSPPIMAISVMEIDSTEKEELSGEEEEEEDKEQSISSPPSAERSVGVLAREELLRLQLRIRLLAAASRCISSISDASKRRGECTGWWGSVREARLASSWDALSTFSSSFGALLWVETVMGVWASSLGSTGKMSAIDGGDPPSPSLGWVSTATPDGGLAPPAPCSLSPVERRASGEANGWDGGGQ